MKQLINDNKIKKKAVEMAKKRTPVFVSIPAWKPRRHETRWGIYVNDKLVDFEPDFFWAKSKARKIVHFLKRKGFRVEGPAIRKRKKHYRMGLTIGDSRL